MAVITRIVGEATDTTDEYLAASRLKRIIDTSIPDRVLGEIVLYPSATLFGQDVKDVDIMMIGHLMNYQLMLKFKHDDGFINDAVLIENFCTTIEVKSHNAAGIMREGTNWKVKYTNGWHNVTRQSNAQKMSAKSFFENSLGKSPYITNLIWFTEVTNNELSYVLHVAEDEIPSNVLPGFFEFSELAQLLVYQRVPRLRFEKYRFECGFGSNDIDAYEKPLALFTKAKKGMGELTRRKIELITQRTLKDSNILIEKGKFNILRGKAGTGKTIEIIREAIKLIEEKDTRVQILTYNVALVADIKRLFALADLPDIFEPKCVTVNTMQAFFYGVINHCLYEGRLSGEEFLSRYQELLEEVIFFMKTNDTAKNMIRKLCSDNPQLNWEYVFIDEAQDWSDKERNLILLLYDKNHILIADGGQQFVREIFPCDWTIVDERKSIRLKTCLRQKNNLIKFINDYSSRYNTGMGKIISCNHMQGGRVIILKEHNRILEIANRALEEQKKAHNIAYDMMVLVTAEMVERGDEKHFRYLKEFEQRGIIVWDGTNADNRRKYAVNPDEVRLLQYESSRGLEGWTVFCLDFDVFLRNKAQQYIPKDNYNTLFLESAEEQRSKYLLNWALIPMTRAIDTLIICLNDIESAESTRIMEVAEKHPDYVEII